MLLNQSSANYENKIKSLNETAIKLLKCQPVEREKWTDGFSDVFALCVSRPISYAPELYNSTVRLIKTRINEILEMLEKVSDTDLLRSYVLEWQNFYDGITKLNNLYSYVNSQYVKNLKPSEPDIFYGPTLIMAERHILEIIEVGLSHWKLCLVDNLRDRLSQSIICQINKDRENIPDEQEYIQPTLLSFSQLAELKNIDKFGTDVYEENFQAALEESTSKFYRNWVQEKLTTLDPPQFSKACLILKKEEMERASKYYQCSLKFIQSIFKKIVVEENLQYINKCTKELIEKNSTDELNSIYCLLSEYNYFTNLVEEFHTFAKNKIVDSISSLSDDEQSLVESFVLNLLSLKMQFTEFISQVFEKKSVFQTALDKAFLEAISMCSTDKNLYIDKILKKGSIKGKTEIFTREALQGAIKIFTYIEDKDIFLKYYQHYLSRRLLLVNSKYSLPHEQSVVYQLSVVCGHEFTANLSLMLEDISATNDLNTDYHKSILDEINSDSQYHKNAWPIVLSNQKNSTKQYSNFLQTSPVPSEFEFMVPTCFEDHIDNFQTFYSGSHRNCKLEWAHGYSSVEILLNFAKTTNIKKGPVTMIVLANLAAFLSRFDETDKDELTVEELLLYWKEKVKKFELSSKEMSSSTDHPPIKSSRMNDDQRTLGAPVNSISNLTIDQNSSNNEIISLKTLFEPLLEAGIIIAEKTNLETNEFDLETILQVNRNFSTANNRLKFVANNSPKETAKVVEKDKQITDDRRFFIQAIIIRIMKREKTLSMSNLINKVTIEAAKRFKPPEELVKTCIQGLIDREFLERSLLDNETLNYLV